MPTVLLARTDAEAADLVTSDVDENDAPYLTGERTVEGFFKTMPGLQQAVSRGLAYAPYADLLWCETGKPDLAFAKAFADAIHKRFPGKMLAYNCSPSFNWKKNLDDSTIARFQNELGAMGYKFQFITLAGFHSLNYSMFHLAHGYARNQMSAFVELQQAEFAAADKGFTAVKHQREVGTGYFDAVTTTIERESSTSALQGSTEDEQFFDRKVGQAGRLRTRRQHLDSQPWLLSCSTFSERCSTFIRSRAAPRNCLRVNGERLARLWREKQIEYSTAAHDVGPLCQFFRRSRAMRSSIRCKSLKLNAEPNDISRLADEYKRLAPFADVAPALARCTTPVCSWACFPTATPRCSRPRSSLPACIDTLIWCCRPIRCVRSRRRHRCTRWGRVR